MDNRNSKTGGRNGVLGIIIRKYMMLFVLIGLFVFLTIISRVFLNPRNIMNLFRQVSVIGIISIGAGTVVIGGTFDMSVGSLCTMTGCACLLMQQRMPVLPAVLLTLLIGIGTGFVNGFIITGIKGNSGDSFMVTYGMLTVLQAIALVITGGYPLNPSKSAAYNAIGSGTIGPLIPVSIIIFFVLQDRVFQSVFPSLRVHKFQFRRQDRQDQRRYKSFRSAGHTGMQTPDPLLHS